MCSREYFTVLSRSLALAVPQVAACNASADRRDKDKVCLQCLPSRSQQSLYGILPESSAAVIYQQHPSLTAEPGLLYCLWKIYNLPDPDRALHHTIRYGLVLLKHAA